MQRRGNENGKTQNNATKKYLRLRLIHPVAPPGAFDSLCTRDRLSHNDQFSPLAVTVTEGHCNRGRDREIEKFIIRQPPKGEKDDYDSENSWISDGLPSSSRRRRRGDGR